MTDYYWEAAQFLATRRKTEEKLSQHSADAVLGRRWLAASYPDSWLWRRLDEALVAGTGYPDRPIELSREDTCLLNFGTSPRILEADLVLTEAAKQGAEVDLRQPPKIPPAHATRMQQYLQIAEASYAESHVRDGLYNLEPWLQEVYRDVVDSDHRLALKRKIRGLETDMCAMPERLLSLGLPHALVGEVMQVLESFESIQDSSRVREKNKKSVINAREYAQILGRINKTMQRAEAVIPGINRGKRSPLQDLFNAWKESTYAIIDLKKALAQAWQTSNMNQSVNMLLDMLRALRETMRRAAENVGIPQCGLIGCPDVVRICPRHAIERTLERLVMYDVVGVADPGSERMEYRRFGPLCMVIVPGEGAPRYSEELRKYHVSRFADESTDARDYDLNRRNEYPRNFIVIPNLVQQGTLVESMAEAFLEYKSVAYPAAYRATLDEVKRKLGVIFDEPSETQARNPMRATIARYLAGFVRWTRDGKVDENLPNLKHFITWAKTRLKGRPLLTRQRYRGILVDFKEVSPKKRRVIIGRHAGGRLECEQRLLALYVMTRDLQGALGLAARLPNYLRGNPHLRKAREVMAEAGANHGAVALNHVRRFMMDDPDLARTLMSFEARFSAEVGAVRSRSYKTLRKEVPYQQVVDLLKERHEQELIKQRREVNESIDRNLLGLLYATEGNHEIAREELEAYLITVARRRDKHRRATDQLESGRLIEALGNRAKRMGRPADPVLRGRTRCIGVDHLSVGREDDYVLYNLAMIARDAGESVLARKYLEQFSRQAIDTGWGLFAEFAREALETGRASAEGNEEAAGDAAETASATKAPSR